MFSEPCSGRLSDGLVTINIPLKESIRSSQFVGRKGKYDSFSQLALFRLPIFHFTNQYLHGIMVSQKYWATSMLTKEIPIEIRKIIGGVIEFKRYTFLKLGLISP